MLLASIGMGCWVNVKAYRQRQRILAALASPTIWEFVEMPLTEIVRYLGDLHQIEVQLDQEALRSAGMEEEPMVTCNLKGISLQSALRLVLRQLHLTYIMRGTVLLITTPQRAAAIGAEPPTVELSGINEERIADALKSPVDLDFKETPLTDAAAYLMDLKHIVIEFDRGVMEQAGIDADYPGTIATINVKSCPLQSALRSLLREHGLDYVIRDEVLFITTREEAAAITSTRQP
jgi:hypothetical protein